MKNNKLSIILIIFLAINLALTCTLVVAFVAQSNKLQEEHRLLVKKIEDIEPCEQDDSQDGLAVMGSLFMNELDTKVDEIAEDIKDEISAEIKNEIAAVEESFSKYDEDIQTIASSLEELNVQMENVNEVILSVQEILDSIKNFFKIG